jgi:dihydroorotase
MIQGLSDGTIDFIATDHAPHSEIDKVCTFQEAAFGISVLETALGSVLKLVHEGSMDLVTLITKLTQAPASFLNSNLGTLKIGSTADITIFDPNEEWKVLPANFKSKGKNTPLETTLLKGKIKATVYGGKIVYQDS